MIIDGAMARSANNITMLGYDMLWMATESLKYSTDEIMSTTNNFYPINHPSSDLT